MRSDPYTLEEEAKIKLLENSLSIGLDMNQACWVSGLNPYTVNNWIREGNAFDDSIHNALLIRCRTAVAKFEYRQLAELNTTHAQGRPAEYKEVLKRTTTSMDENGKPVVIKEYTHVLIRSEVEPDARTRQWLLSHRFKAKWGDKLDIIVSRDMLDANRDPEEIDVTRPKMSDQDALEQLAHYAEQLRIMTEPIKKSGEDDKP